MRREYDPHVHDDHKLIFWRWRSIYTPGSTKLYLRRLYLLRTPWFGLMLHWIYQPDSDRWLHNHPWWFCSLVLRGGYDEMTDQTTIYRPFPGPPGTISPTIAYFPDTIRRFRFNRKRLCDAHKITSVQPNTLTLVLHGPKKQKWGFLTDKGFVYWRDYLAPEHQ